MAPFSHRSNSSYRPNLSVWNQVIFAAVFGLVCTCLTNSSEASDPAHLANISTRLNVGVDDDVLIGGFIVRGSQAKKVILRAIGPSLVGFGITAALADPTLELHDSSGAIIATNDNWQASSQVAEIAATGLAPSNPLESAIVATLQPGSYTAIVRGTNNTIGVALVEVYELDSTSTRLANISARGPVGIGDDVLIGGVIVSGSQPKSVIVRAIGPSLSSYGVNNALANPTLELHDGSGALVASNDDWTASFQYPEIAAGGHAPSNPLESAILTTLSPGNYTAIVRGVNNATGVALVEVYDLDPDPQPEVWIAIRNDGAAGSGTQSDPYDGSTAEKFDRTMNAVSPNTTIHLGAGTFLTNGAADYSAGTGFEVRRGQQILGAGRDVTIIKLMHWFPIGPNQIYEGDAFAVPYNLDGSNSVVADLTVDLNSDYFAQHLGVNSYKLGAVTLRGNNCTIRNVHVIHGHGDYASALEAFTICVDGFYVGGAWQSVVGALIENCLVDQSALDYGCAICLINQGNIQGFGSTTSGGVRNNTVKDWAGTSAFGFLGKNVEFSGNTVIDCSLFIYGDTGVSSNIWIHGNTAYCGAGSQPSAAGRTGFAYFSKSGGAAFNSVTIENNTIVVRPATNTDGTVSILLLTGRSPGLASNYLIRNNSASLDSRSTATTYAGWGIEGVDNVSISGNSFDRIPINTINSTVTNLTINGVFIQ